MSPERQHPTLGQWLASAPFGLTLSSGFFGFFAHCGLISALEEHDLKPATLSGASAGALVAGLWAAGLNSHEMQAQLFRLDKADFWDPGFGAGLLRGQKFRDLLKRLLPVQRFEDCHTELAVSTTELLRRRTRVISSGELVPAIYASCCVPIMFQPIRIANRLLVDGGVTDRPGIEGMRAERVLYHHLASRSPWRSKRGAQTVIPERSNMHSLVIAHLPRVGPNQLAAGRSAFERARAATLQALDTPLDQPILRV